MGIWQESRLSTYVHLNRRRVPGGARMPRREDLLPADHPQRSETKMIRTYPICPAHLHRHDESLRAIVNRLQRDIENEHAAAPARSIRIPSPTRPARRTF
jgi:hypothetical protein